MCGMCYPPDIANTDFEEDGLNVDRAPLSGALERSAIIDH